MNKFLFYIIKLSFVGILLATIISEASFWSLRKGNFYKPTFVENTIAEEKLDYVILGASTALTGIDTKLIDSITGMKGYNLAIDDTGLPNSYLMLQHYLAARKRVDRVILVPTVSSLNEKEASLGDNDHRFLMYNKREYIHDYYKTLEDEEGKFPVMTNSNYFPFLGLSYYNVELFFPSLVSLLKPEKRNRFDEFGNYTYPNKKFKPKPGKLEVKNIDFQHPYFNKIVQLCQKEKIKLMVYFAPIYNTKLQMPENNFQVIDYTDKLKDSSNFYDVLHVNAEGRRKVTEGLAEKISHSE